MFDSVGLGGRIGGSRRGESVGLPPGEQPISVKAPWTTISETRNHLPTADLVYFQVLGVFIPPPSPPQLQPCIISCPGYCSHFLCAVLRPLWPVDTTAERSLRMQTFSRTRWCRICLGVIAAVVNKENSFPYKYLNPVCLPFCIVDLCEGVCELDYACVPSPGLCWT